MRARAREGSSSEWLDDSDGVQRSLSRRRSFDLRENGVPFGAVVEKQHGRREAPTCHSPPPPSPLTSLSAPPTRRAWRANELPTANAAAGSSRRGHEPASLPLC
jgi:hypothetical protein